MYRGYPYIQAFIRHFHGVKMTPLNWLKERGAPLYFFGAFLGILLNVFLYDHSFAKGPQDVPSDLTRLTLEELMDIQVTSVSKGEEDFSKAASAIFVLTQEDIRRSGVNTIPEALRMVPGVHVAQIDSSTWAISARGFNSRFANKLLVMIDGRSVYNHVFAGVFWDEQDLVLEDVERIEVIRGPGGALWGANAVNGVINIITKNAKKTLGGQVSAGAGNLDRFIGSIRYGEKIGEDAAVRVYGKYYNRNNLDDLQGNSAPDEFESGRGGMRWDWDASESNSFTLQGDVFAGEYAAKTSNAVTSLAPITTTNIVRDAQIRGGNLIGRWKHRFSESSDMALQFFYNHDHRDSALLKELLVDTYDLDFQHRFQLGKRHEILWGLGHRYIHDSFRNSVGISYFPSSNLNYISNAFIQDKIALIENELHFTIGSKFSVNNFTGLEIQPNARLAWTPNDRHTVWAAVSRAVRTPNRSEDSGRFNASAVTLPGPTPAVTVIQGQSDFESEDLLAVELGYRVRPHDRVFLDVATFANFYEDLQSFEFGTPFFNPSPGFVEVPIVTRNRLSGETYGVELAATWDVLDWWRLNSTATWLAMDLQSDPSSTDFSVAALEDVDPEFQWNIRSHINLPSDWEFDQTLYYVDALKSQQVGSYFRLDLRLGWRPTKNIEVSVVGQNLLDSQNQEWGNDRIQTNDRNLIERSVFGKVVLKF
jgi:iron complex outermembrane receptor protein